MKPLGSEQVAGARALTLRNAYLEVTVLPDKGADIYTIVHRESGMDVLFKSPWGLRSPGPWPRPDGSMGRWLEAYAGGWQLLLPNGGDECTERGAIWGFHGEASLVPWRVLAHDQSSATLEALLFSAPLHVLRELSLDGPVLRVREVATNLSTEDVEVMWSHHPAFGAPFLDESCVIHASCRTVAVDAVAPGTLLGAGTRHPWPAVTTPSGDVVDLSQVPGPSQPRSVLAYLGDFESGYFAITNPRLGLGVGLRWPLEVFPNAWLWEEVHSTRDWPWFGRAYVVAVEPASTIPAHGMANARAKGSRGVRLAPRASQEVLIEGVVFRGRGDVVGIGEGGVVHFASS